MSGFRSSLVDLLQRSSFSHERVSSPTFPPHLLVGQAAWGSFLFVKESAWISLALPFLEEVANLLSAPGRTWRSRTVAAVASSETLLAVVPQRDGLLLPQCDMFAGTGSVASLAWIRPLVPRANSSFRHLWVEELALALFVVLALFFMPQSSAHRRIRLFGLRYNILPDGCCIAPKVGGS